MSNLKKNIKATQKAIKKDGIGYNIPTIKLILANQLAIMKKLNEY